MFKKTVSLLLTVIVIIGCLSTAFAAPTYSAFNNFEDTQSNKLNYAADAIGWAVMNNITNGTSKTKFSPYDTCTRAQIVTFLWRMAGEKTPASMPILFEDVTPGSYYANAVRWATSLDSNRITNGTDAKHFSPHKNCTRAEIVTFLWRFYHTTDPDRILTISKRPFVDVPTDAYYSAAVEWAAKCNITAGVDQYHFDPYAPCTRAQAVTFLFRAWLKFGDQPGAVNP